MADTAPCLGGVEGLLILGLAALPWQYSHESFLKLGLKNRRQSTMSLRVLGLPALPWQYSCESFLNLGAQKRGQYTMSLIGTPKNDPSPRVSHTERPQGRHTDSARSTKHIINSGVQWNYIGGWNVLVRITYTIAR